MTVTVDADSGDRPPYLSDTTTLPADGRKEYDNPIPDSVEPTVRLSVDGGPENSREWPGEGADSKQFYVKILDDEIVFVLGER